MRGKPTDMKQKEHNLIDSITPGEAWFQSYQDKYILSDNLGNRNVTVKRQTPFFNSLYTQFIVVTQGSLHLEVNGVKVVVKADNLFIITPCTSVDVKESKCYFYTILVRAHLLYDSYASIPAEPPFKRSTFYMYQYRLKPEHVERLLANYYALKRELVGDPYPMKENALRAIVSVFLAKLQAIIPVVEEIKLTEDTRTRNLFDLFLTLLDRYHTKHRNVGFYAKKIGISPKYLSSVTMHCALMTASGVIEQFIAFRIRIMLYDGTYNVKSISEQLSFPTQSFFGRYFKRITGISPREYVTANCKHMVVQENARIPLEQVLGKVQKTKQTEETDANV